MRNITFAVALSLCSVIATGFAKITDSSDLSRHDFFYAGESKSPRMYIVRNGAVEWYHLASNRKGEISDAILMTDGKEIDRWDISAPWSVTEVGKADNLLIVGRNVVKEIDRQGNTIWEKHPSDYDITSPQKAVRLRPHFL